MAEATFNKKTLFTTLDLILRKKLAAKLSK
jgi:hypothetical protein